MTVPLPFISASTSSLLAIVVSPSFHKINSISADTSDSICFQPFDQRSVYSSLQNKIFHHHTYLILCKRRDHRRPHSETSSQAADYIIFSAPSHARKFLAVRIRPSPGSKRSITSPNDTASYLHSSAGRKFNFILSIAPLLPLPLQ